MRSSTPRLKSPLITAVEIENFKGIGRPVRLDLRPITLLFGRNSAGKSTILHALCYAHEVLSHRNADPHKVELGGDQIDLGGFRNLVHEHNLDRVVRLRFELNLEGWSVPQVLVREMQRLEDDETVDDDWPNASWSETRSLKGLARTACVTFAAKWSRGWQPRAVVESYEVGVDGSMVGRIAEDSTGVRLLVDPAHFLFRDIVGLAISPGSPADSRPARPGPVVAEPPGAVPNHRSHGSRLHGMPIHGATSPLPAWNELLYVDPEGDQIPTGRADGEYLEVDGPGSVAFARFRALLSGTLVGIGQTLRDELARLRYVGPVRKLRPPTNIEPGTANRGHWSDGSAAWSLLAHAEPVPGDRGLIDDVNRWLGDNDRLDAGYTLRRRTTVELPDDAPVNTIRIVERALGKYRDQAGVINLDGWIRHEAAELSELVAYDAGDIEARLRGDDREARSDADTLGRRDSAEPELITQTREIYRFLRHFVAQVEEIASGRNPARVREIVRAIAKAPARSTLQLVAWGSGLPVQTSDVGTGISQLLPVVVAALDPDRPGLTAIEQPELHAHPKLQVELGDLFAHAADDGRVFLLENHSEHLMLRLLRRIEETQNAELPEGKPALRPDQVSVVYLDQVDGEVRATRLRIDETGEFIDRWPHGFFEERDDELF